MRRNQFNFHGGLNGQELLEPLAAIDLVLQWGALPVLRHGVQGNKRGNVVLYCPLVDPTGSDEAYLYLDLCSFLYFFLMPLHRLPAASR
eukprot:scaffold402762_cov75-Attheya_sp.AAC.4